MSKSIFFSFLQLLCLQFIICCRDSCCGVGVCVAAINCSPLTLDMDSKLTFKTFIHCLPTCWEKRWRRRPCFRPLGCFGIIGKDHHPQLTAGIESIRRMFCLIFLLISLKSPSDHRLPFQIYTHTHTHTHMEQSTLSSFLIKARKIGLIVNWSTSPRPRIFHLVFFFFASFCIWSIGRRPQLFVYFGHFFWKSVDLICRRFSSLTHTRTVFASH